MSTPTSKTLIEAMQASPYREIDLEPARWPMPVREFPLHEFLDDQIVEPPARAVRDDADVTGT